MRTVRTTPTVTVPRVKLGSIVLETQYGTSQKANEDGQGIPILRMGNITNTGHLDLRDLKHVVLPDGEVDKYSVRKGDLLFNRTNSPDLVGKMAIWDRPENFAIAGYLVRVRLHREIADPRFVSYWFNTLEMKAELRAHAKPSINMSNISASELLKFDVPLLPLPEQRRIADVLDRAEALRAKRRAALAELDGLADAIFVDLFGDTVKNPRHWATVQIRDIGDIQGGLQVTTTRSMLQLEIPYLRVANVYRDRIDLTEVKSIRATESEVARTNLAFHDLLIVEGHGNPHEIGRCGLWTNEVSPCVHQNHIIRVRVDNKRVDPVFSWRYLNSTGGRRDLLRAAKTTSGLNTISVSNVKDASLWLPPLALQQEFARRVAAVERLKAVQRASLAELDALFASLQDRAFRGAL